MNRKSVSFNWCFAIKNYTSEDIARLSNQGNLKEVAYLIFAEETGINDIPYLHGMICFKKEQNCKEAKSQLNINSHVYPTRVCNINRMYYKRNNTHTEWGEWGVLNLTN